MRNFFVILILSLFISCIENNEKTHLLRIVNESTSNVVEISYSKYGFKSALLHVNIEKNKSIKQIKPIEVYTDGILDSLDFSYKWIDRQKLILLLDLDPFPVEIEIDLEHCKVKTNEQK